MPFFEYYFEPSGNDGMVFLQFNHKNYEHGKKCKQFFEYLLSYCNYILLLSLIMAMIMLYVEPKNTNGRIIIIIVIIIYLTRFLNPIDVQYKLMKVKKQK